jgi:hypothetical protein
MTVTQRDWASENVVWPSIFQVVPCVIQMSSTPPHVCMRVIHGAAGFVAFHAWHTQVAFSNELILYCLDLLTMHIHDDRTPHDQIHPNASRPLFIVPRAKLRNRRETKWRRDIITLHACAGTDATRKINRRDSARDSIFTMGWLSGVGVYYTAGRVCSQKAGTKVSVWSANASVINLRRPRAARCSPGRKLNYMHYRS